MFCLFALLIKIIIIKDLYLVVFADIQKQLKKSDEKKNKINMIKKKIKK